MKIFPSSTLLLAVFFSANRVVPLLLDILDVHEFGISNSSRKNLAYNIYSIVNLSAVTYLEIIFSKTIDFNACQKLMVTNFLEN